MTLSEYREMLLNQPWFDVKKDKPSDGEKVLVKFEYGGSEVLTYFAKDTGDAWWGHWDGAGFYAFNDDLYEYYMMDNIRYWLPAKRN